MSLIGSLNKKGIRRLKVSVYEIERNPLNHYNLDGIEELAANMNEVGQLENATVYELPENEVTGSIKYRLLGGERRWSAIKHNHESGLGDGQIEVVVRPAPKNQWEEHQLIRSDNIQREKTNEDRLREVKLAVEEFDYLESIGKRPEGLKQDWVGKQVGLSGRRAADWMNLRVASLSADDIKAVDLAMMDQYEDEQKKKKTQSNGLKSQEPKGMSDAYKLLKNALNALNKSKLISEDSSDSSAFQFYHDVTRLHAEVMEVQKEWESEFDPKAKS